jgi:SNF2 family DNA or RNA helicase
VLLSTDVGAEGLNLQFCRVLVNFDLPWNPMLIEQRIGRLHRYGQTSEVHVHNLCARGTIEERVLNVLHERLRLFELVIGEMDMVLGNMTDDRDLEEQILAIYAESSSEEAISHAFEELTARLLRARGHHQKVKALDDALFGKDYVQ